MDITSEKIKPRLMYLISMLFIGINAFFISQEFYFFSVLPIIILFFFIAVTRLDVFFLLIVFLVPLSISLNELGIDPGFDAYLPTEPMIIGAMVLVFIKLLIEKQFDKRILLHPISIAMYVNLLWILITSFTSTMPGVSFKFFLVRVWFLVVFYFLATQIFSKKENIRRFFWAYIAGFLIVIVYTLFNHFQYGMTNDIVAHFVMKPFFNDHTSYGAIIAMYLPVLVGLYFIYKDSSGWIRFLIIILTLIYVFALIFSYTRAAWLSVIVAICVLLAIRFRIRLWHIGMTMAILILLFISFQTRIMIALEQNEQDSSADIAEHIKSIANITTDASNMERINRWKCAFRMFSEKPFFGWGPGTYMFNYAPFQRSYDRTIISTNAANLGNAHSEYIGPLAESGVIGTLSFIFIIVVVAITVFRLYKNLPGKENRIILLAVSLGLVTYLVHGMLNNFLDTDKASAPFWGFIAVIVALEVYHNNKSSVKH